MCFYSLHFNSYVSYQALGHKEMFAKKELSILGTYGVWKVYFRCHSLQKALGRGRRGCWARLGPGAQGFVPTQGPRECGVQGAAGVQA